MIDREYFFRHPDPSVRLLALRELGCFPESEACIIKAKSEVIDSQSVASVKAGMHPDGYWLQKNPRSGEVVGDGVAYGAWATTHFRLSYLAELGLDRTDPVVALAAERYLGLMKPDGDFWDHFSCLQGYNLRTFIKLGYRGDERLKPLVSLMLSVKRDDGGYLCDWHERKAVGKSGKPLKRPKSCFRGTLKILLAFSYMDELRGNQRIEALLEYFLGRHGIFRSDDHSVFALKDIERLSFPVTWRCDLVQVLYALARLGNGRDPRLDRAWDLLEKSRNRNGFLSLGWTPSQCPWKVGKKGSRSDWLTLYAEIALKNR